jgi:hypothetical protein
MSHPHHEFLTIFEREMLHRIEHLEREVHRLEREIQPPTLATSISFTEITMLPTQGGNTLVYTGTLAPAGSVLAPDFVATVTSNDPAVLPTVDSTGLIVTIPLPAGWVESTTTPLAIQYATTSATTSQALSATITPSAPVVLASSVTFVQTT